MNTVIEKQGDSFVVRIPDVFADKINLVGETSAELSLESGRIVIKTVSKPELKYTSDTLADDSVSKDEYPDITKIRTWELCSSLEIEKPDPRYVVAHGLHGRIITDYAEHTDEVLTE
jgi:antitoxin component of MazEF toxin-antitoxin module